MAALPTGALPPLNFSAPATSSAKNGDFLGGQSMFSQGDWNVSTGSGDTGLTFKPLMWVALGAGVLWFLSKRKKAA